MANQDENNPADQAGDQAGDQASNEAESAAEESITSAQESAAKVGEGAADPATPVDAELEEQTDEALKAAQEAVASVKGDGDGDADPISQIASEVAKESGADSSAFTPPAITPNGQNGQSGGVDLLADVNLHVKIELGRTRMFVEDVLKLSEGAVVELDKAAGDPVDIYVNERHVARGEVLVINDCFCVRVSEIVQAPSAE